MEEDAELPQYARQMSDDHDEAHHFLQPPATSAYFNETPCYVRRVQGGHVVRSTGRKDRHSKVCTAKGQRDRRVRLSAHTAIQFYDVQDRLGFDRPSKAVDWLIKKAQTSIDELALLPPCDPADAIRNAAAANAKPRRTAAKTKISPWPPQKIQFDGVAEHPSYLPPSMDSDSIADTMSGWEQQSIQRLVSGAADNGNGGGGSQYFAPLHNPLTTSFQPVLGQSQFISQRGPLQSSYAPMIRAWFDHSISTDDLNHHHHIPQPVSASARFQGQEEEQHDGLTNKPSSASSVSRH